MINETLSNMTLRRRNLVNTPERAVEIVFLFLICILILLGNSLVILAYLKGSRRLRTRTNFFVINLAVSDIMVGCISLPFWITVRLGLITTQHPVYEYFISLDVLFGGTSIFCLTAISLERMFAVKYSTMHRNLKDRPFYITLAGTWFLGLFILAFKFIFGPEFVQEYTLFILMLAFLLPLAVIVCCYVVIFYTARNMFIASNQGNNLSRDIQVAKTISVIIGLFVLCWSPFFFSNMVFYYGTEAHKATLLSPRSQWLVALTKALHYSNSMTNFFVYAVRSPDFRQAFEVLIVSRCKGDIIRERLRTLSNAHSKFSNILKPPKVPDGKSNGNGTLLHGYRTDTITGSTTLLNGIEDYPYA